MITYKLLTPLQYTATLFCSISFYNLSFADEQPDIKNIHQCVINNSHSKTSKYTIAKPVANAIYLEADTGQILQEGTSTLNGDVFIQQNNTVFTANNAKINRQESEVTATGNVVLTNEQFQLKSQRIKYNLNNKTGVIDNAEYSLGKDGVHGKSSKIQQVDKDNLHLQNATFTSCPINMDSWHLASENIKLNQKTQIGTAKNVTFKVGKTPVFYFPWFEFPLKGQRLSGFLSPSISLQTNAGVTIPYYLNLAPNYDATLSLSTLESRGILLGSEFRILSKNNQSNIEYDLIPQDNSFNDESRYHFKINSKTRLPQSTDIKLNAEIVSDEDYFDDFSDSLETSTRSSLQRRLEISRNNDPWKISTAVEDYQILDSDDDTYSKLPEIIVNYTPKSGPKDLKLEVNSEIVHFDKDDDETGVRADIKTTISKKWGSEAWYFKPTLSLESSLYSLENTTSDDQINRTLPTFSLDTGLFFDRDLFGKNSHLVQTLEPRIFYTHTPYKDQSDIPIFDTALFNFSESNQLFLENRFTGKDRIADTNQITFAVSSRLQDRKDGTELLKATIGQVFFFSDRKVTLPGGTILTNSSSDLLLELSGRINDNLRLASTVTLDNIDQNITNYDLRLNYQDKKNRILNLSFRELEDELRQVSFSTALPINDKWSMVASSDHDTKNDRNLESLIGFEYQDCCWKTRLVAKRYLTSDNTTYETPIYLEFELKGLGNIGKGATRQIKDDIYGYDNF